MLFYVLAHVREMNQILCEIVYHFNFYFCKLLIKIQYNSNTNKRSKQVSKQKSGGSPSVYSLASLSLYYYLRYMNNQILLLKKFTFFGQQGTKVRQEFKSQKVQFFWKRFVKFWLHFEFFKQQMNQKSQLQKLIKSKFQDLKKLFLYFLTNYQEMQRLLAHLLLKEKKLQLKLIVIIEKQMSQYFFFNNIFKIPKSSKKILNYYKN
eukprot:TRINITY_DN137_c0_g1_i4.p1 TRINITY_DN137_c0_g1~~TRINITY_DN137_c0_g1_i4.p1  ORF type:complete len:206 (+),score=-10.84 TRINITY_DN137_c0_g1_i4:336-953(+)